MGRLSTFSVLGEIQGLKNGVSSQLRVTKTTDHRVPFCVFQSATKIRHADSALNLWSAP